MDSPTDIGQNLIEIWKEDPKEYDGAIIKMTEEWRPKQTLDCKLVEG